MPTRLPTGLSFVRPGARTAEYTATDGDTTPDVSKKTVLFCGTSGVTIVQFDGIELGQSLLVYSNSATVTTLANNSSILLTSSATDVVLGSNQCMQFLGIADNVATEVVPRS